MRPKIFTVIYLLAMVATLLRAQTASFTNYTAADGLSDNNVLCALRDSYGFMWLGTNNGLNRFDGFQNTVYRNMIEDDTRFENNTITALFEQGLDIWFGGSFGLYVYHRQTNSFSRFDKRTKYGVSISCTVNDIVSSRNGLIWIATLGQGLFVYNPQTDELKQDSRHGAFLSDIVVIDNGPVYIASLSGVILTYSQEAPSNVSQQGQARTPALLGEAFLRQYAIPGYESDKNFISLETLGNQLYIGSEQGLYCLDESPLTSLQRSTNGAGGDAYAPGAGSDKRLVPVNVPLGVRALCSAGSELLIGTDQGLFAFQPSAGVRRYQGMNSQKINGIMFDRDSTLWVMTQMNGVYYLPHSTNNVQTVRITDSGPGTMIRALCESGDGNLWLGTDQGLLFYDRSSQQTVGGTDLRLHGGADIRQEVSALMLDGTDLWIGTQHDGIFVQSTTDGRQRHYQYSANRSYTLPSNEVTCLLRTSQGIVYVGTSWGLCRYEQATDNFMWYFGIGSLTTVTSLTEDKNGCVWVGTSNHGIFRQNSPNGDFRNYTYHHNDPLSVASNDISTVFCDHAGTVWVALTGGGLCRFLPDKEGFEAFETSVIPIHEQQVYFITEDNSHNLWLGMESAMLRIGADRSDDGVQMLRRKGLVRLQKPRNTGIVTSDGELFAGRFNMLAHFRPERIVIQRDTSPVYVTAVTLPFRSGASASGGRLEGTFGEAITLNYADNSFTLHFSSPEFQGGGDYVLFEYMLEGIDKSWAKGTKNAEATYVKVPPGKYRFLLRKAGNTDPATYAQLSIEVLPPWYRTTVAWLAYLLLIGVGIFLTMRGYSNRLRKRYNQRMEAYQAEQEKSNFESKIRFFINLVHEIRTPLTLISLPLEALEESLKGSGGEDYKSPPTSQSATPNPSTPQHPNTHIAAIRRNTNYLLGITNQLLDFQKAESGKMQLNLNACDVGTLLTEVYSQFEDAMAVQGKRLQLQLPDQPISTVIDVDKVQKVLMNLLGNAGKYARSEIIVRLEQLSLEQLRISVIDDGPGVPENERDKIFNLYYQIGNDSVAATLGTGLGLSYAKMLALAHDGDLLLSDSVGGGSNFQLVLPIKAPTNLPQLGEAAAPVLSAMEASSSGGRSEGASGGVYRVLLVEDNEELLQMTTDVLRPHYRVLKARDGVEALDVLRYNEVDVIVSDVMMPRMDGNELCRRVKEDINYSHIPVILLTAKTSIEAKVEGMQSGANVYLEKPFSAKQLQLQISSLLRMRQHFYERMRQIDGFTPTTDNELGMNQQDIQFMEHLQKLVADNMRDDEFSIDQLAEQMNMSRSSFYRKIKALTDMTPIEYLKMRRLEQAARLLKQGIRITEVAERVGFTSSSYFAKCFKAKFGVLPKDYV